MYFFFFFFKYLNVLEFTVFKIKTLSMLIEIVHNQYIIIGLFWAERVKSKTLTAKWRKQSYKVVNFDQCCKFLLFIKCVIIKIIIVL